MGFKSLATGVYVAGQIGIDDINVAAKMGIRTIICNRPDAETPDQPATDELALAAADAGLEFCHIPIVSGQFDESSIEEFGAVLRAARAPILAYCRSGMRSSCLWALASAGELGRDDIVSAAADAGYDLNPLAAAIDRRCDCELSE